MLPSLLVEVHQDLYVRLRVVESRPLVDPQFVNGRIFKDFATVYVRIEEVILCTLPRIAKDPVGLGNLIEFRGVAIPRMVGVMGLCETM